MTSRFVRLCGSVCAAFAAGAFAPMDYLTAYGHKAETVLPLTWFVLIVSIVVMALIAVLVLWGSIRRGERMPLAGITQLPVGHTASGLSWITIGVGISTLVLLFTVVATMAVLAAVNFPSSKPAFTVVVTGHQWWWEAKYIGPNASDTFTTANEIHIPTGVPVLFQLKTLDVIHSFWVPPLNGKTDTIPGQTNVTWLDADKPGVYRGQCTEYCGLQHAHMALLVIADTPDRFRAWWRRQLADAPQPTSGEQWAEQATFIARCGACHAVRGTDAAGVVGPDLSHLMARQTIASGTLPNTPGNLMGWVADPQRIKPGALMPRLELTGHELQQIHAYLASLK